MPTSAARDGTKSHAASRPSPPSRKRAGPRAERVGGGAAARGRGPSDRGRAAARLVEEVAAEAIGAVVEEHLAEDRVVAAAVHVGTVRRGNEGDDAHPAQGDGDHGQEGEGDLPDAAFQAGHRRRQYVGEEERRQDDPGLEHFGLEGEADPDAREDEGLQPSRHEGGRRGVRRQHQEQNQERVRDVAAVQQDGDRCRGQGGGRHESGPGAADPADGAVEHQDGQRPLDGLRQHHRPDVEAEEADGQGLQPEGSGQLVDRDRSPRVEGAEEEVVPVLRHAAHRRAVERLESRAPAAPAVREQCQRGDQQEGRSGPARLIGRGTPELPAAGPGRPTCGRRRAAQRCRRFLHEAPAHVPHPAQPSSRAG